MSTPAQGWSLVDEPQGQEAKGWQPVDSNQLFSQTPETPSATLPPATQPHYRPTTIEDVTSVLPAVGGLVGGLAGGTAGGVGAIPGAAAGGMAGRAIELGIDARFGQGPILSGSKTTMGEVAQDVGTEGFKQGAYEAGGQLLGLGFKTLGKGLARTAEGRVPFNISKLPSEAGAGSIAGGLEHLAGKSAVSKGVIEAFREKQSAEIAQAFEKELRAISRSNATPEQLGQHLQTLIERYRTTQQQSIIGPMYSEIDKLTEGSEAGENIVYRSRDVGERGVPDVTSPAQASSSREQVEGYLKSRSGVTGKPQEMVQIDLSKLPKDSYQIMKHPDGMNWVKFNRPLTEAETQAYRAPVMPSTAPLKAIAKPLLERLHAQQKLMDKSLYGEMEGMLTTIMKSPDNVGYRTMADSRSDMLALARKLDDVLPGKRAGVAKLMSQAMDQSMMSAAEKSGIQGLPEKIRAANSATRELHRKMDQDLIRKIVETGKPELAGQYIRQAGLQETRDLMAMLRPEGQQTLKTSMMLHTLEEAVSPQTGRLEPQNITQAWHSMGEEKGRIVFGRNYDRIDSLMKDISKIDPKGSNWGAFHDFTFLVGTPIAAMTAAATGHFTGAAGALATGGAEALGLNMIARGMTNPETALKWVTAMRLVLNQGPRAVATAAKMLDLNYQGTGAVPSAQPSALHP